MAADDVPHHANGMVPAKLIYGVDHVNFLFYEKSPGVPLPNPFNPRRDPRQAREPARSSGGGSSTSTT